MTQPEVKADADSEHVSFEIVRDTQKEIAAYCWIVQG